MGIAIVCVPLHVDLLGLQQFGFVSVFVAVQSLICSIDFGLSASVGRDLAIESVEKTNCTNIRGVFWFYQRLLGKLVVFQSVLILPVGIALILLFEIPGFPTTNERILLVVLLATFVLSASPIVFYGSALIGIGKQVEANCASLTIAMVRHLGIPFLCSAFDGGFIKYIMLQVAVNSIHVAVLTGRFWILDFFRAYGDSKVSPSGLAKFSIELTIINVVGIVVTQLDKIALGVTSSGADVALYSLAFSIAIGMSNLSLPLVSSIAPRVSQLFSVKDFEGLDELYFKAFELIVVLVSPVAAVFVVFPDYVVLAWTGKGSLVSGVSPLLGKLCFGTFLNCLCSISASFLVCARLTRPLLVLNSCIGVIYIPSVFFVGFEFGPVGIAFLWVLINLVYVVIVPYICCNNVRAGCFRNGNSLMFACQSAFPFLLCFVIRLLFAETLSRESAAMRVLLVFIGVFVVGIVFSRVCRIYDCQKN